MFAKAVQKPVLTRFSPMPFISEINANTGKDCLPG